MLNGFHEKGVGGFFTGDGGGGSVAGVDGGVAGEGEDFLANAGKEEMAVAAGEVPAADGIGEEDIAAKKLVGGGKVEAEAAGAVAGDEEELGVGPGRRDRPGFLKKLGGGDGAEALGEAEGEHGVGLEAEGGGIGVVVDGAAGPVGEVGGVPDMVPVAVGEEKGVGLDFFLFEKIEEAFGGVDGEAVAGEVEEVGVGGGEAAAVA
jgi:hypothetical protein